MGALLIFKCRPVQPGHASLVALHVVLQVMAGHKSFATGRIGAGKWPLIGVRSRVLLQIALCCEETRTTRLAAVECVSWRGKLCISDFCWLLWRGWFAWTGVTVYSEEKSTRVCGHTFLEFEFDNLCGFSCVLSACRGWRRLRRSRRIPRTQKASPSCGSWPQNSNLVTSQHLRHGNLDI